jgi:hypothetical protein
VTLDLQNGRFITGGTTSLAPAAFRPPEMSAGPSTTPDMQQNLPPELPSHRPQKPAGPVVVPMLPTRRPAPGRHAPLPDPVAMRRTDIPDTAPPYDDESAADQADARPPVPAAPPGLDARAGARGARPDNPGGPGPGGTDPGGPGPGPGGPGGQDPGPGGSGPSGHGAWPSQFAQVLAETLAGSRPARQLTPWTTEQTRKRIRQLGPLLSSSQQPRIRRIMTSAPCQDVLELTAVVGFGPRVRVLAVRLERAQDARERWRCTAIESA